MNLYFFSFMGTTFCALRNFCSFQRDYTLSYVFFQKLYGSTVYFQIYYPIETIVCTYIPVRLVACLLFLFLFYIYLSIYLSIFAQSSQLFQHRLSYLGFLLAFQIHRHHCFKYFFCPIPLIHYSGTQVIYMLGHITSHIFQTLFCFCFYLFICFQCFFLLVFQFR